MSRLTTICLSVLLCLAIPTLAQEAKAQNLVRQAYKAMSGPDPGVFDPAYSLSHAGSEGRRKAIELFTEALEVWPQCTDALVGRSMTYSIEGEGDKAKQDALSALEIGIHDRDFLALSGSFEGAEAREVLEKGLEQVGVDSPLYNLLVHRLASTYWYEEEYRKQAEVLESLTQRTTEPMYHEALGRAWYAAGELTKAEMAYSKVLPNSALSLVHLKMHTLEYAEALTILNKHGDTLPEDEFLTEKAVLDALLGHPVDYDTALATVQKVGTQNLFGQDDFQAGVLEYSRGNKRLGRYHLRNSMRMLDSNPLEWGVTLAWKRKVAEQLLSP
jgi:hypothetical protein